MPWAKYLNEHGYTVNALRLPGHGTTWEDANTKTFADLPEGFPQALFQGVVELLVNRPAHLVEQRSPFLPRGRDAGAAVVRAPANLARRGGRGARKKFQRRRGQVHRDRWTRARRVFRSPSTSPMYSSGTVMVYL